MLRAYPMAEEPESRVFTTARYITSGINMHKNTKRKKKRENAHLMVHVQSATQHVQVEAVPVCYSTTEMELPLTIYVEEVPAGDVNSVLIYQFQHGRFSVLTEMIASHGLRV